MESSAVTRVAPLAETPVSAHSHFFHSSAWSVQLEGKTQRAAWACSPYAQKGWHLKSEGELADTGPTTGRDPLSYLTQSTHFVVDSQLSHLYHLLRLQRFPLLFGL
jgi:hypothetical protein